MRKGTLLIAVLAALVLGRPASAATVLYEANLTGTTNTTTGVRTAADSVKLQVLETYVASDWFPIIIEKYSAEQGKMISVVPDSMLWSIKLRACQNGDKDSVTALFYLQTSDDRRTVYSTANITVGSITMKTASYTMVTAEANASEADFSYTTPLAKWGRLLMCAQATDGTGDSTLVHFPIVYRALATKTPAGSQVVIDRSVLTSTLTVAKNAGTAVYSPWFPLTTKVYSSLQGKWVDVVPDEFQFTARYDAVNAGNKAGAEMWLETSEDQTTLCRTPVEIGAHNEGTVTYGSPELYGAEATRATFTVTMPLAKWGRIKFLSDTNDSATSVTTLHYRGLLKTPIENNLVFERTIEGASDVDTISVPAYSGAVAYSYSAWFPLEVSIYNEDLGKYVTVIPDEFQFSVKGRYLKADTFELETALQVSEDRTVMGGSITGANILTLTSLDDATTTTAGLYRLFGNYVSRVSFVDETPYARWGRLMFWSDSDSDDEKSIDSIVVRAIVNTPSQ